GECLQQPHPDIKDLQRDLEVIIEAAKYQAALRQATLGTGGDAGRYFAPTIVDLIAAGQVNDLFGEKRFLVWRNYKIIDQDIIDERRAHSAGKTKIIDLNGRRTQCHDIGARIRCESHEIHQDIYSVRSDAPSSFQVRGIF